MYKVNSYFLKMESELIFASFINYLVEHETMETLSNYRRLARLATFFWDKLTPEYKSIWKDQAREYNQTLNLHGRKKSKGFWMFAITLKCGILTLNCDIFHEIWANFIPEYRDMWLICLLNALRDQMGLIL